MAAFGASVVASDRVAGAELLQRDIAKRRHEAREAMEASRRDVEAPDGSDEGDIDGEDIDGDGDVSDGEEERASASDSEEGTGAESDSEEELESESDSEEELESESDDAAVLESDSDGRVVDPVTGLKRKRMAPALSMAQKRELASAAVKAAEASGAPAPKVRKNGVLSLSELRRRAREVARAKRNAAEAENELLDADSDSEKEARIEHDRILGPEDFKRIKALRTAGQLGEALDRSGARKARRRAPRRCGARCAPPTSPRRRTAA